MRLLVTGALVLAASASQLSAQSFTSVKGAPDKGFGPLYGDQSLLIDFNGGPYTGFSFSGSYSILPSSVAGAANPAGATGGFFATPNVDEASTGSAKIDFSSYLLNNSLSGISFYWGSIDSYNTLQLLGAGDAVLYTITGSQVVNPANGNQTAEDQNRRLFIDFGAEAANFRALRFTSQGRAFEIDDIAGSVIDRSVSVPEPATLSMLTFGIAMLGVAGARRKRVSSTV